MNVTSQCITDKLWRGILPADDPMKTCGGLGSGLKCSGCDEQISSGDPELEVDMPDGQTLRFHVACEGLWRVLKQALPPRS